MSEAQASMPIALLDWKGMRQNSLRGFATVRIGRSLKVCDVTVHVSNGKRWASLPSKPLVDKSGAAKRDDNGKIKYVPVIEWMDRDTRDRFSDAVIAAVEAQYPGTVA